MSLHSLADQKFEERKLEALREDPSYGVILDMCKTSMRPQDFERHFVTYAATVFDSATDILTLPFMPENFFKLYIHKTLSDSAYKILKAESFALALEDCSKTSGTSFVRAKFLAADIGGKAIALGLIGLFFAHEGSTKVKAQVVEFHETHPIVCRLTLGSLGVGLGFFEVPKYYSLGELLFSPTVQSTTTADVNGELDLIESKRTNRVQDELKECENDLRLRQKALEKADKNSQLYLDIQNKIQKDQIAILLFKKALNVKS